MHRCFINDSVIIDETFSIGGDDRNHIVNSLRMKIGEGLEVVGANGSFLCEIVNITAEDLRVKAIEELEKQSESHLDIVLYQALAKGDKMDFIVQKASELGVKEIHPINSVRTVVKLDAKRAKKRIDRLNTIAKEACKQSRRDYIPEVRDIIDLRDIKEETLLVAYETEEEKTLKAKLKELKSNRIAVLIGPEGGFDPKEIEFLSERGAHIVSLGPRILRTETAGLALVSIIQYELGDMGE